MPAPETFDWGYYAIMSGAIVVVIIGLALFLLGLAGIFGRLL